MQPGLEPGAPGKTWFGSGRSWVSGVVPVPERSSFAGSRVAEPSEEVWANVSNIGDLVDVCERRSLYGAE